MVTAGPRAPATGADVAVAGAVGAVAAVVVVAVAAGTGVTAATAPVPGSNAPVMSVFGSSAGRATEFGEPGLYWPRYRLPCMSSARSGGRFFPMMTDLK